MSAFDKNFVPAKLEKQEEKDDDEICRTVLENLQTGVCVVNLEKKISFWSDGAERITGYRRHEVVGRVCAGHTLLQCDQTNCQPCPEDCPVSAVLHTAKLSETSGFLHHKSGHEIPVHVWAVPIRNSHGSIIGVAQSFEDHAQPDNSDHREDSLKASGCVDETTGIANHAMMQSHLRETLGTFAEIQLPFAVLCIRLEGLDLFRANYGGEAAISLLRMIANTLENTLWKTDFLGRWSDDQFLVILNGCGEDSLHTVRERIHRLLSADGIEWWGDKHSLPVKVGETTAFVGDTVEILLQRLQLSLDQTSANPVPSAAVPARRAASGS